MTHHPRCDYCGRFINYRNFVVYTPFGSNTDLEPPDEVYICISCYDEQTAAGKQPILIAWIPPVIVRDGVEEVDDGRK